VHHKELQGSSQGPEKSELETGNAVKTVKETKGRKYMEAEKTIILHAEL
jgi:hypothetical protein